MTALSDLIAKLEAAKDGDKSFSVSIAIYIGDGNKTLPASFVTCKDYTFLREMTVAEAAEKFPARHWEIANWYGLPDYTTSLDAALTLVPEDLSLAVKSPGFQSLRKTFLVELESDDYQWCGEGWNPALALCIAALKARASK